MNRYFVYLMVFVAAMLIAMPVLADNVYTGRVMSAGSGQIMIMEPSGEMRMFSVGSEARILHDGKAAVLDDIDDGDVANVTVKSIGGKSVVVAIEARSMG